MFFVWEPLYPYNVYIFSFACAYLKNQYKIWSQNKMYALRLFSPNIYSALGDHSHAGQCCELNDDID